MNTPKQDVAVFIDFENIYVSVREKFDATPNFEAIMEKCEDYGRVVVARAYADWYRYPRITSALFANNIEPMYVPTYYYDKDEGRQGRPIKNSVDMHMCIDAMRTLYTRGNISKYIFITGDRDFIALVNCVRQEGKDVIIIGIGGAASGHLAQSADEFLFYEQIVEIRPMGHTGHRVERVERPERIDRFDRPERVDRNGREGRDERRRDRPERPSEKGEPKAAEKPVERPVEKPLEVIPPERTPIVAVPTATGDQAIYDKLIEALELARKRGYVSSFGSLKVLMKELMPNFKESRYRNAQGKPFTKFTDFVREAERLGKIQIFTSGTVNEVFLPDEDPYKLSQFAEDLPSVEAERELEQELAAEAIAEVESFVEPVENGDLDETASISERAERTNRRRRRRGGQGRTEPTTSDLIINEPIVDEEPNQEEIPVFGEREWALFDKVMSAYSEPVPFADIFNDLREMRNTEELELTNNALKELIKQAINAAKVQRSNRGAKAHYRVVVQPSVTTQPDINDVALPDLLDDDEQSTHDHDYAAQEAMPLDLQAELDLPDLVEDEPVPPSMIRGELVSEDAAVEVLPAPEQEPVEAELVETGMIRGELITEDATENTAAPEVIADLEAPLADITASFNNEPVMDTGDPSAEPTKPAAAKGTRRRRKAETEAAVSHAETEEANTTKRRAKRSTTAAETASPPASPRRRKKVTGENASDAGVNHNSSEGGE